MPRRLGGGSPGRWGWPGRRGLAVTAGWPWGPRLCPRTQSPPPPGRCPCLSLLPLPLPPAPPRAPVLASIPQLPFPGPRTCKELLTRGHFLSGWHTIYLPDCRPLTVLCDMDVDGGGWTVSGGDPAMAVGFTQRWPWGSWAGVGVPGSLTWWQGTV